jgi:hypothetical protein
VLPDLHRKTYQERTLHALYHLLCAEYYDKNKKNLPYGLLFVEQGETMIEAEEKIIWTLMIFRCLKDANK